MVKCWLCNQAPGKGPEGVCGGCCGSALAVAPDPFVTGGHVSEPLCYPTDEGLEIHAPVVDEDWLQPHNTPLDPTLQGGLVPASNLTNKNKITQKKTGESARFASRGSPIVYPECGVFSPLSEKSSKRKQSTRDSSANADIENIPTKSPRLTSKSKRDENYVIKEPVPAQVAMPASSQPGLVPGRGKGRGKGRGRGRAQARDQWSNFAHRSPLDSIYPSPKGGEGWKSRGKPRGKHTLRGRGRSTVCRTVTQEVEGPTCRPSASMGAPPGGMMGSSLGQPTWPFQGMSQNMGQNYYNTHIPFPMGMHPWMQMMCPPGFTPFGQPPPVPPQTPSQAPVSSRLGPASIPSVSLASSVEVGLGSEVESEMGHSVAGTGGFEGEASEVPPMEVSLSLRSGLTPPRRVVSASVPGITPLSSTPSVSGDSFTSPPPSVPPPPRGTPGDQSQERPWSDLVQIIEGLYPDEVGQRTPVRRSHRVIDDSSVTDGQLTARQRLPLYPAVSAALDFTSKEVALSTSSKVKAAGPLPIGRYPQVDSKREALPPSLLPEFNSPALRDSALEAMAPGGKSVSPPTVKLSEESLKLLERDQKVALSSLSYAMWSAKSAASLLAKGVQQAHGNVSAASLVDVADLLSASRRWLLTVADRLVVDLSTILLLRRDGYLAGIDKLMPEPQLAAMRSAPFSGSSLFSDRAGVAAEELSKARQEAHPTQAIQAMSRVAKQLVSAKTGVSSAPKGASTASQVKSSAPRPAPQEQKPRGSGSKATHRRRDRRSGSKHKASKKGH